MSIESHVFLRGFYENLPEGARNLVGPEQINTDSPETVLYVNLLSGDNAIAIPVKALGCLILFNSLSTVVKKIKGVNGDTGIIVHPTRWFALSFTAASQAGFVINVSANDIASVVNLYTTIVFF